MTASSHSLSLDAIRDALRRAISKSSLRAVARDVGMTAPGLQSFIDGGQPRAATTRKLNEWYVRDSQTSQHPDAETAQAALTVLLDGVPESRLAELREVLLSAIRNEYQSAGIDPPAWSLTSISSNRKR